MFHWKRENGKRVPTETFIKAKQDPEFNNTQGLGLFSFLANFNLLAEDGQPHDLSCEMEYIDNLSLTDRQKEAYKALGWENSVDWYIKNGVFAWTGLAGSIYIDPASELGKVHQKMTELRASREKNTKP